MKNLVVVIDWQNVVLSYDKDKYAKEIAHAQRAIEKTAKIIDAARRNGDDVAWVAYTGNLESALGDDISGIVPELRSLIQSNDLIFTKLTKSASGTIDSTGKIIFDDALKRDYKKIIFTGTSVTDCVQETIRDAAEDGLGEKIVLPRDACAPSAEFTGGQASYFSAMQQSYGITTCSTERVVRFLEKGEPLRHIPFGQTGTETGIVRPDIKTSNEPVQRPT